MIELAGVARARRTIGVFSCCGRRTEAAARRDRAEGTRSLESDMMDDDSFLGLYSNDDGRND